MHALPALLVALFAVLIAVLGCGGRRLPEAAPPPSPSAAEPGPAEVVVAPAPSPLEVAVRLQVMVAQRSTRRAVGPGGVEWLLDECRLVVDELRAVGVEARLGRAARDCAERHTAELSPEERAGLLIRVPLRSSPPFLCQGAERFDERWGAVEVEEGPAPEYRRAIRGCVEEALDAELGDERYARGAVVISGAAAEPEGLGCLGGDTRCGGL